MTTIKEIRESINTTLDVLEVQEQRKPKRGRYLTPPKLWDTFFYPVGDTVVKVGCRGRHTHKLLYSLGLCFYDKESAELYQRITLRIYELLEKDLIDWSDSEQEKWFMNYDHETNDFDFISRKGGQSLEPYLTTTAKEAIEKEFTEQELIFYTTGLWKD